MSDPLLDDEIHLELVRLIEANPSVSQRELASKLGVSLGKVNYCLKALVDVGWVKAGNFAKSNNKLGYAYVLTPTGIKEKAAITARFLMHKQAQYKRLETEIARLQQELELGRQEGPE